MIRGRGMGWLPDVPKPNDYNEHHPDVTALLSKTRLAARVNASAQGTQGTQAAAAAVPPSADLRPWFSPIEDQGHLGSCTANAAAGLLEYFERRAHGNYIDASRLFIYKAERDSIGLDRRHRRLSADGDGSTDAVRRPARALLAL